MDSQKRSVASRTPRRRSLWIGGLALCAALFVAGPALADRDFERGFEDEMGRILAHETVGLARAVIGVAAPLPVVTVHRPAVFVRPLPPARRVRSAPPRWARAYGHARHDWYDRCDHRDHDGRYDRHDRHHR